MFIDYFGRHLIEIVGTIIWFTIIRGCYLFLDCVGLVPLPELFKIVSVPNLTRAIIFMFVLLSDSELFEAIIVPELCLS